MATKFVTSIHRGEDARATGRQAAERALARLGGGAAHLAVVFASSRYDSREVVKGVRDATGDVPLIGCTTAGEFTEESVGKDGVACALISTDAYRFYTGLGTGLSGDEMQCLRSAAAGFPLKDAPEAFPYRSAVVLLDGLSGKGEEISLSALAVLGADIRLSGGSAADDYKFKETAVFSGGAVSSDAVSACFVQSKHPVAIGVEHGHTPVSGPFTITKAEGNKVYELDGKPAVQVWLDAARESARKFGIDVDTMWDDPVQLSKFSCIYEGGLATGQNYKIRWSGLSSDVRDHLSFVCSMPEGAVIRVMESSSESEIESARSAARSAVRALEGRKAAGAIVFDCAVRGALLGAEFPKAVEAIRGELGGIPLVGLETYGEIAHEEGQLSGFHNTTTVILLLPE